MADLQKFGQRLQGFGAGVQGRGPEFIAGIREREQQQGADLRKEQLLFNRVLNDQIQSGNIDSAVTGLNNRLLDLNERGANTDFSTGIKGLLEDGSDEALAEALRITQAADREAVLREELPALEVAQPEIVSRGDIGPEGGIVTRGAGGEISTQQVEGFNPTPPTVGRGQINAGITVKDDNGDLFTSSQAFNPNSGEVTQMITAIDGSDRQPAGQLQRVTTAGVTAEESVLLEQRRAAAGTRGTGSEGRIQTSINSALVAAESTAVTRRAISLLQGIETGGAAGFLLKANALLGTNSADEGELIGSLGKAVLSQLRETFGAAFTENEGARLERIEANIGNNKETNTRLLQQALTLAERAAERGIAAATESGDTRAAADIRDLLDFRLTDTGGMNIRSAFGGDGAAFPEITTQGQYDALRVGDTFIEDGVQRIKQ